MGGRAGVPGTGWTAGAGRRAGAVIPTVVALALLLAACSGSQSAADRSTTTNAPRTTTTTTTTTAPSPASTTTTTAPVPTPTWLCRPGMADNPCLSSLKATVVGPGNRARAQPASPAPSPKIDCFYVYPTVSTQTTANADLTVDPQETAVAVAQASRFSQVCNVYAPMYRQVTVAAIDGSAPLTPGARITAYGDVLAAWQYYLAHFNHGRGVAFIGHSQGAAMLITLLKSQVDPDPAQRSRLVSAILLGGGVTVPVGKSVGGTFAHIPACTDLVQPGCVIAYSSFDQAPPANSIFGRVASPVNILSGQTPVGRLQVLCVNPVAGTGPAPSSGVGPAAVLTPYFPTQPFPSASVSPASKRTRQPTVTTPWVTYPRLYRAQCESRGGATWLQVDTMARSGDTRPVVHQTLGPAWGLHLVDVNIALGNLVGDLARQAVHYRG